MNLNEKSFFLLVFVIFIKTGCTQYAQKKSDKLYFSVNETILSSDSDNSTVLESDLSDNYQNNDSYMVRKLRRKVDSGIFWAWKVFSLPRLLYPDSTSD